MHCPSCGAILQKLTVSTNEGGVFEVDHCGSCGGTWFDPYEVNRIPYHEVARIAKITVLSHSGPKASRDKKCPRCHKILHHYQAQSIPANVRFWRCVHCHGIWAGQKSLEIFKQIQEDHIQEYKKEKLKIFPSLSVVFVPALAALLLVISTFITVHSLEQQKETRIQAENFINNLSLLKISADTLNLSFTTPISLYTSIEYGQTIIDLKETNISLAPRKSHIITLTALKPSSVYIYRLVLLDTSGKIYKSEFKTFKTE
jgi:Zn-finger nucleic acid-binding protein